MIASEARSPGNHPEHDAAAGVVVKLDDAVGGDQRVVVRTMTARVQSG